MIQSILKVRVAIIMTRIPSMIPRDFATAEAYSASTFSNAEDTSFSVVEEYAFSHPIVSE